ncbi:MAG: hybrid sensor histidine kinase/response regulator [Candidatus Hydrogenedentes bacterium]|nr:hybrid sensor histidine kinase/response regulator [Candidatus Hydrogenedentota bacterium]
MAGHGDGGIRGRILVVDDENGPRQALRMLLKEEHDVVLAEDVGAAQAILETDPIDIIITDIRMPRQTGVDLLRWAKDRFPDVEVVILTGFSDLKTAMKAVEYGAFAYLEKPFDSSVLLQYVEQGLHKRRRELERRQLEELALEANRFETLGRFVSGMLHDLGTPLAVIGSQAELLLSKISASDQKARLEAVLTQCQLCSEIVRTAMNFLRHKAEHFVLLNLNEVARGCLDVGQPVLTKHAVSVREDFSDEIPLCQGDFVLVRQAILNLITNACQAMEDQADRRELSICTWQEDDEVCLAVGDTGPGIPAELREHVFKTFFTTKGDEGTGLGLVAVRNIMQRHNGDVVLGDGEGRGALFVLRFPCVPNQS